MKHNDKKHMKNKEENTMAIAKPTDQAFVLNSAKSEAFLTQDNSKFKNMLAKLEKYKKSHGATRK